MSCSGAKVSMAGPPYRASPTPVQGECDDAEPYHGDHHDQIQNGPIGVTVRLVLGEDLSEHHGDPASAHHTTPRSATSEIDRR